MLEVFEAIQPLAIPAVLPGMAAATAIRHPAVQPTGCRLGLLQGFLRTTYLGWNYQDRRQQTVLARCQFLVHRAKLRELL